MVDVDVGYITSTDGTGKGHWHRDPDCRGLETAKVVYDKDAEDLDDNYDRCSICFGDGGDKSAADWSYQESILAEAAKE